MPRPFSRGHGKQAFYPGCQMGTTNTPIPFRMKMRTINASAPDLEKYLRRSIGRCILTQASSRRFRLLRAFAPMTGSRRTQKVARPIQQRSCAGFSPDFLRWAQNLPIDDEIVPYIIGFVRASCQPLEREKAASRGSGLRPLTKSRRTACVIGSDGVCVASGIFREMMFIRISIEKCFIWRRLFRPGFALFRSTGLQARMGLQVRPVGRTAKVKSEI